jgi:hypothetical protein
MFSLFGWGQPRKTKNDVQSWLDRHFPGQLEVLSSASGATWNNYNTALVNLEIGARDDAEVWFRVQAHNDRSATNRTPVISGPSGSPSRIAKRRPKVATAGTTALSVAGTTWRQKG